MPRKTLATVHEYGADIDLFTPFLHGRQHLTAQSKSKLVEQLLEQLEALGSRLGPLKKELESDPRRLLHAYLNIAEADTLDEGFLTGLDVLLQAELAERDLVQLSSLKNLPGMEINGTRLTLWQGDITLLCCDAIVNAANNALLGCFRPLHMCIDNVIHSRAGARLRDDCQRIMARQGTTEPTGAAKITRAYNLPARFVLHTVGPVVHGEPTRNHARELERCYRSCLDLCKEVKTISSLAFCSISTGVFGYPPYKAAQVALSAIYLWLEENPGVLTDVIIDVYSERDNQIYKELLHHYGYGNN